LCPTLQYNGSRLLGSDKTDINFLLATATFSGFYPGLPPQLHGFPFMLLIDTVLGTLLVWSARVR
jgi:hypothetical protein